MAKKKRPYRAAEESQLRTPAAGETPWLVADKKCWKNRLVQHAHTAFEAARDCNLQGKDGTPLHFTQVDCIALDERALATRRTVSLVARSARADHERIQRVWAMERRIEAKAKERRLAKLRGEGLRGTVPKRSKRAGKQSRPRHARAAS